MNRKSINFLKEEKKYSLQEYLPSKLKEEVSVAFFIIKLKTTVFFPEFDRGLQSWYR
jgi:hypothetical protein